MTEQNDLHILSMKGIWIPCNQLTNVDILEYQETFKKIKQLLDKCQGVGKNVEEKIQIPHKIISGNIITDILRVESHRFCTVCFCIQYNKKTNGLRYIVYGTEYNTLIDTDYGIGVNLKSVISYALNFCPLNISTKLI